MVVGFTFIFECETTVRNVVEVLEPFEVGNGDTTSVDVQVRNDKDVAIDQNLVGSRGSRSIGSFSDDLIVIQQVKYETIKYIWIYSKSISINFEIVNIVDNKSFR